MLETLAIVAYRQPITRPEIEDIRGVDCGGVLRLLLDRTLVRILGKKEEAGRPILYGTTKQFLEFFHLKDLAQLPTLREFTELTEEMTSQLDPDEAELVEGLAGEAAEAPTESAAPATEPDSAADAPEAPPPDAIPVADAAAQPTPETQTWARATASTVSEDEEDEALVSLDSAIGRIDEILRAQRREERARLGAPAGETPVGADAAATSLSEAQSPPVEADDPNPVEPLQEG